MKIRRAQVNNTSRIADIHVESWRAVYRNSLPADFLASLDVQRREAMWRSSVENNEKLYVVETELSQVIGFLCISAARDEDLKGETELTAIYLDPGFYGRGIGTAFWREIERDIETGLAYLWVLAANPLGIAFYEKNGFRPDGTKKSFKIGEQEYEELRYRKLLQNQSVHSNPAPGSAPSGRE